MLALLLILAQDPATPERVEFKFKDAPVETVLQYVSRVTGCAVVIEAKVAGTVDAYCEGALSQDEVLAFLDTVLARKGLATVREGKTISVVTLKEAHERLARAEKRAADDPIPGDDRVRRVMVPLKHLNVAQVRKEIDKLLPPGLEVSVAASSNAFIFEGRGRDIAAVQSLLAMLDAADGDALEVGVMALQHADAAEMAREITEIFIKKGENEGADLLGFQGVLKKMAAARNGGEGEARPLTSEIVRVVADARSNAVVVAATREHLAIIRDVVGRLDEQGPSAKVVSYHLFNADAAAVAKILNDLNSEPKGEAPRRAQRMWWGAQNAPPSEPAATASALRAIADTRTNAVIVAAPESRHAVVKEIIEDLDRPSADVVQVRMYPLVNAEASDTLETVKALVKSGVEIVADARSNALVARGLSADLASLGDLIGSLDARPGEKEGLFLYRPMHTDAKTIAETLNNVMGTPRPQTPAVEKDPFAQFNAKPQNQNQRPRQRP